MIPRMQSKSLQSINTDSQRDNLSSRIQRVGSSNNQPYSLSAVSQRNTCPATNFRQDVIAQFRGILAELYPNDFWLDEAIQPDLLVIESFFAHGGKQILIDAVDVVLQKTKASFLPDQEEQNLLSEGVTDRQKIDAIDELIHSDFSMRLVEAALSEEGGFRLFALDYIQEIAEDYIENALDITDLCVQISTELSHEVRNKLTPDIDSGFSIRQVKGNNIESDQFDDAIPSTSGASSTQVARQYKPKGYRVSSKDSSLLNAFIAVYTQQADWLKKIQYSGDNKEKQSLKNDTPEGSDFLSAFESTGGLDRYISTMEALLEKYAETARKSEDLIQQAFFNQLIKRGFSEFFYYNTLPRNQYSLSATEIRENIAEVLADFFPHSSIVDNYSSVLDSLAQDLALANFQALNLPVTSIDSQEGIFAVRVGNTERVLYTQDPELLNHVTTTLENEDSFGRAFAQRFEEFEQNAQTRENQERYQNSNNYDEYLHELTNYDLEEETRNQPEKPLFDKRHAYEAAGSLVGSGLNLHAQYWATSKGYNLHPRAKLADDYPKTYKERAKAWVSWFFDSPKASIVPPHSAADSQTNTDKHEPIETVKLDLFENQENNDYVVEYYDDEITIEAEDLGAPEYSTQLEREKIKQAPEIIFQPKTDTAKTPIASLVKSGIVTGTCLAAGGSPKLCTTLGVLAGIADATAAPVAPTKKPKKKKLEECIKIIMQPNTAPDHSNYYSTIGLYNICDDQIVVEWENYSKQKTSVTLKPRQSNTQSVPTGIRAETIKVNGKPFAYNGKIVSANHPLPPVKRVKNSYKSGAYIQTTNFKPLSSLEFLKNYSHLIQNMPDPMSVASKALKAALVKAGYGDIDPDKTYYHRFSSAQSDRHTQTGWKHYGPPVYSLSLTQAAMVKPYTEFWEDMDVVPSEVGIYKVGYQTRKERPFWDMNAESRLTGQRFIEIANTLDVQAAYTKVLNDFWSKNADKYASMLKDSYQISLANQRRMGLLSEGDYYLGKSLIENRKNVVCYRFNIYGYPSTDIIMIEKEGGDHGGLLYLPGAKHPFTSYANRQHLVDAIFSKISKIDERQQLENHFTKYQRQDGTSYSGVDTALSRLAGGAWDRRNLMQRVQTMPEDVFGRIALDVKNAMVTNGDLSIKSNAEAKRDYFLNTANAMLWYLPVFDAILPEVFIPLEISLLGGQFGSALDKAINGDTLDERMEGTFASVVTGAFLGASLVIPGVAKAASSFDTDLAAAEKLLTAETEIDTVVDTAVDGAAAVKPVEPVEPAAPVEPEIESFEGVPDSMMNSFTTEPKQILHPVTKQILLGVELADTKQKVLLRAVGFGKYVKIHPEMGLRLGGDYVYRAINAETGEMLWIENFASPDNVITTEGKHIYTTWGADDAELASITASNTNPSEREEIFFKDDVKSLGGGSGYPDMTGMETPELLNSLDERARVDPLSVIPDPEQLRSFARDAQLEASTNIWRNRYSQEYANTIAFRGDGRFPEEIFHSGFIRRAEPIQITDIGEGVGISGAVSTTRSGDIALRYAKMQSNGGYIYGVRLRDGGMSINSFSTKGTSLQEVAVLNVPAEDVMFAIGPFDTVYTGNAVVGQLPSIELRLNPYSTASAVQAGQAFEEIKQYLSQPLHLESVSFAERWAARAELIFSQKELDAALSAANDYLNA